MLFKKKSLIVSCQAEGDDPFNSPSGIAMFAKAAEMGGASGVRIEGVKKIIKVINEINIPVIGLIKSTFNDGMVKITGSFKDVEILHRIGCKIIAIDGTNRIRDGITGPMFISIIKQKYDCLLMADISTVEEAIICQDAGANFISSTLNGYTPDTKVDNNGKPNFEFAKKLVSSLRIPVFAEGRISTPNQAKKMIDFGVHGVVVGTSITRPRIITSNFTEKINL
jgi:N-acylglucosamine-6-phosphate 2-epimerase